MAQEVSWPASWWRPRTRRYQRLAAAIESYRIELGSRLAASTVGTKNERVWGTCAKTLLDQAEAALHQGRYSRGWHDFAAARRQEIRDYGKDELNAAAEELRQEAATKITSWRRDAIMRLLSPACSEVAKSADAQTIVSATAVYRATLLRDDYADNVYRRIENLSVQLITLGVILLAAVILVLVFALRAGLPIGKLDAPGTPILSFVVIFGLLGGSISAARSVMGTAVEARIPDQLASWYVVALRPLVGAAAAVGAFVLLQSGFIASPVKDGAVTLAVAFAAGFSQELIIGAVAGLGRGSKETPR